MKKIIPILFLFLGGNILAQDMDTIETDLSCETCHVDAGWNIDAGRGYDHTLTGFDLKGVHDELNCGHCHPGATPAEQHDFTRSSSECNFCHEDIHNDQWGQDCSQCHNFDSWTLSTQDQNHDLTRFPLQGAHRNSTCESCHLNQASRSSSLRIDCASCHLTDHENSVSPSHITLELSFECESCHPPISNSWDQSSFNHNQTGYALLGRHFVSDCESCHTQAARNTPNVCESCHMNEYVVSLEPDHEGQGYPFDCQHCHDSFNWNSTFTHDGTGFILNGAHLESNCFECHLNQQFDDTPDVCLGCHTQEWEESEIPPHNDAEFDLDCEACHTELVWAPSTWDHDLESDYPLTGGHIGVSCELCHEVTPYSEQSADCYECHQPDYEATTEPNHLTALIPTNCDVCHTTENWDSEEIDHNQTQFPLIGAHVELECLNCHEAGYILSTLCESCHMPEYTSTSTGLGPDHEVFEFSMDCQICHNQFSWSPSDFDHDPVITGYEIEGAHLELLPGDCFACHEDAIWSGISKDCHVCHQSNFVETTDPDHQTIGFPDNLCETCHSQSVWVPSIFNHTNAINPCETCHIIQYNSAVMPPHADAEFDTQCQTCHTTELWVPGTWDHSVETEFDIQGAHETLNCSVCHTSAPYNTLVNECATCHQDNYEQTTEPDHAESGYPIPLCESCHDQSVWQPSIFEHESTSESCMTCHMVQYNATLAPPHLSQSFSTDCAFCHTTDAWTPSSFTHDLEVTGFLLDGAHEALECSNCHESWDPPTEIRTCASSTCHLDNYQSSENPPHETMGFSSSCADCHSTSDWVPSAYNHDLETTGFALEEAHTIVSCQQCHTPWQIVAEPRICADASCHLSDYQGASDPNHESASFPMDCESCHSMTAWVPSTFDHDSQYFPIYSGQHNGEWNDCSQCHVNNADFAEFTCFGGECHSAGEMNDEHFDEDDGQWESCDGMVYPSSGVTPEDCLTCHPTGDEDDCGGTYDFRKFFPKLLPRELNPDETN